MTRPCAGQDAPEKGEIGLIDGLKTVHARMSPIRRRHFVAVILLMLAGAAAELATIGAVIPFLTLLARVAGVPQEGSLAVIRRMSLGAGPLITAAALFMLLAIAAGIIRLQLARSSRRFTFRLGHELTLEIQRRVLFQPFRFHVYRNTSTLLTSLNKTETFVYDLLLPLMQAIIGVVIAVCVIGFLLAVAPFTSLSVAAAFGVSYALISMTTRRRLASNSAVLETSFDSRLQIVQESLGGIRDVILDEAQSMYLREFELVDSKLADARAATQFISLVPRYLTEVVAMVLIAAIALVLANRYGSIAAALPVLGALALGAERLLPLVQDVYAGWSFVQGQRSIFSQVVELLSLPIGDLPRTDAKALDLCRSIKLEHVTFTYPTRDRPGLDEVSLTVPHGTIMALVGPTGSGKSTLLDILMGLLPPDSGRILIDDLPLSASTRQQWHRSVAHVPQSIFLADAPIGRNIALSIPEAPPDPDRIIESATKAQLHDFIVSLPEGYDTPIGERGVRLSGGQRQRLGIARAIYKRTPVLVLDEATSALDDSTEAAVMASLQDLRSKGRTIIMVAHRLSTVRHCDLVARLEHGRLVEIGTLQTTRQHFS